jgi:hypothetical protein
MSKLVIKSYDEEYDFPSRAGNDLEKFLEGLKLDTFNEEYVVTIIVDKVGISEA